ncbi:MAG: hypothetical protein R2912_10510 [Eubacteriales bacterium]
MLSMLAGVVTNATLMENGQEGAKIAFSTLFSSVGGTLLFVFVIISLMSTLNEYHDGLHARLLFARRTQSQYSRKIYCEVSPKTNTWRPTRRVAVLLLCVVWLAYFYGANLVDVKWFGVLSFDSSELPIITVYAMLVPMFLAFLVKQKDLGFFKRILMPALGILGCLFMVYAAIVSHKMAVVWYLVVFVVIMKYRHSSQKKNLFKTIRSNP